MNFNNLAQKTNYIAGSSKLKLASMYLTSVNVPGVNLSHPEVGSRSGARLNISGDTLTFNSLSFEILMDEDFLVYQEFMDKIFQNINPETGSFANTEFDFWIEINNNKENKLLKLEFDSCRIESVGDMQLDTQDDITEFTLPVEVKFDMFRIIKSGAIVPTLNI